MLRICGSVAAGLTRAGSTVHASTQGVGHENFPCAAQLLQPLASLLVLAAVVCRAALLAGAVRLPDLRQQAGQPGALRRLTAPHLRLAAGLRGASAAVGSSAAVPDPEVALQPAADGLQRGGAGGPRCAAGAGVAEVVQTDVGGFEDLLPRAHDQTLGQRERPAHLGGPAAGGEAAAGAAAARAAPGAVQRPVHPAEAGVVHLEHGAVVDWLAAGLFGTALIGHVSTARPVDLHVALVAGEVNSLTGGLLLAAVLLVTGFGSVPVALPIGHQDLAVAAGDVLPAAGLLHVAQRRVGACP
mmetsp:Transcript_104525/g.248755  ORF Transcript_104525/g.248755 Transcript_104525/m.248755 type:complete len:299 (+) Transcript_104525:46-942(+)|eukprot:CAMPEP_0181459590 /NCGR_PEP_ID=MMETSP1110-20121109/32903_1 /TAXON_ID=174948 /ORGANISM="Symbiodinium sp., Strain CCMP421" /LENGTH=298 /DNA_ID=CAMNT_0023584113 /DNA_START=46 /DNA_END=942 /DNA_ORIENTATION=-